VKHQYISPIILFNVAILLKFIIINNVYDLVVLK